MPLHETELEMESPHPVVTCSAPAMRTGAGHTGGVVVRADGNSTIGMGHIMRCIGLAQELVKQGQGVTFALGSGFRPVTDRLALEELPYLLLEEEPGTKADAAATLSVCRGRSIDLLIVDGYNFDQEWLETIRSPPHPRILLWTDYPQNPGLSVDIALDQTPAASETHYLGASPTATALCGLRYAVLRREFLDGDAVRRRRIEARRILVTMGGAGNAEATLIALEAIRSSGLRCSSKVVIGPASRDLAKIASFAERLDDCEVYESVHEMSGLLSWADLAISAAGASLWEFAYSGLPTLAVSIADNQIPLGRAIHEFGGGIYLGDVDDLSVELVANALAAIQADPSKLPSMSDNMLSQVDGKGASRVVRAITSHLPSPPPADTPQRLHVP